MSGWIGVDLDGTLAEYGGWKGPEHIGPPIPEMVARVKAWLAQGREVRIFTARVSGERVGLSVEDTVKAIEKWTLEHVGRVLPITCVKDYGMVELWDDRAVRVVANEGRPCCNHHSIT